MALQYFQNTLIKPWMNIGCDQIVCNTLTAANIIFTDVSAPTISANIFQGLTDNVILRTKNGNVSMTFNQSTQDINVISSGFNVFELTSSVFMSTPILQGNTDDLVLQTNSGNIDILLDQGASKIILNGNVLFNSGSNSVDLPANRGTNGQVLTSNGSGSSSWASLAPSFSIINGNSHFNGLSSSIVGASFNFQSIQPLRTGSTFNNGLILVSSGLQVPKTGVYFCVATVGVTPVDTDGTFCVGFGVNNNVQPDFLGTPVVIGNEYFLNCSTVLTASANEQLSIMLAQSALTSQTAAIHYWSLSAFCIQ